MRGAPAVLWNGAKDPLGKGSGTELMPSSRRVGTGQGMCWQVLAGTEGTVHSAHSHCSCHGLQSASHAAGNGQGWDVSASST